MGKFLEDFGKSGAAESLQRVTGAAVDLAKTQATGAQSLVGTAIDLEKMALMQRDQVLQEEKHKSDMEMAGKQKRIVEEQAKQAEAKGRWLRGRVNPGINQVFSGLPAETQKMLMDEWKGNGELDAEGTVSRQGMLDTLHSMNTNAEYFDKLIRTPKLREADQAAAAAIEELRAEQGKGAKEKPEKLEELRANVKATAQQAQAARGNMDKVLEDVKIEEAWERRKKELSILHTNALERIKASGSTKAIDTLTTTMNKLAAAEKAKVVLQGSGGIDATMMAVLSKANPDMAAAMQGTDKTAALKSLDALIKRYNDVIRALGGGGYYTPSAPQAGAAAIEAEIKKDYE